jgi:hypothetical protein
MEKKILTDMERIEKIAGSPKPTMQLMTRKP